ncbi:hypothetical protein HY772_04925 [Candidatus Woesearchaeota archaeon]|nr:hypothetical protein [Candidatus Woesearchaeota archaeon]
MIRLISVHYLYDPILDEVVTVLGGGNSGQLEQKALSKRTVGESALRVGDYSDAIRRFKESVYYSPSLLSVAMLLEARATDENQTSDVQVLKQARAHLNNEDYQLALKPLLLVNRADVKTLADLIRGVSVQIAHGKQSMAHGDFAAALAAFEAALVIDPGSQSAKRGWNEAARASQLLKQATNALSEDSDKARDLLEEFSLEFGDNLQIAQMRREIEQRQSLRLGKMNLDNDRFEQAIQELVKINGIPEAVDLLKQAREAQQARANAEKEYGVGNYQAAREHVDRLLSFFPGSHIGNGLKTRIEEEAKAIISATTKLEEALALTNAREWNDAVTKIQEAVTITDGAPNNKAVSALRASLNENKKRIQIAVDEANKEFEESARKQETLVQGIVQSLEMAWSVGDLGTVEKEYRKLPSKFLTEESQVLARRGESLYKAASESQELVTRAQNMLKSGDYDRAREQASRALELMPSYNEAQKLQKHAEAARQKRQIIEQVNDERQSGHHEKALKLLDDLNLPYDQQLQVVRLEIEREKHDSDRIDLAIERAVSFQGRHKYKDAQRVLQHALAKLPETIAENNIPGIANARRILESLQKGYALFEESQKELESGELSRAEQLAQQALLNLLDDNDTIGLLTLIQQIQSKLDDGEKVLRRGDFSKAFELAKEAQTKRATAAGAGFLRKVEARQSRFENAEKTLGRGIKSLDRSDYRVAKELFGVVANLEITDDVIKPLIDEARNYFGKIEQRGSGILQIENAISTEDYEQADTLIRELERIFPRSNEDLEQLKKELEEGRRQLPALDKIQAEVAKHLAQGELAEAEHLYRTAKSHKQGHGVPERLKIIEPVINQYRDADNNLKQAIGKIANNNIPEARKLLQNILTQAASSASLSSIKVRVESLLTSLRRWEEIRAQIDQFVAQENYSESEKSIEQADLLGLPISGILDEKKRVITAGRDKLRSHASRLAADGQAAFENAKYGEAVKLLEEAIQLTNDPNETRINKLLDKAKVGVNRTQVLQSVRGLEESGKLREALIFLEGKHEIDLGHPEVEKARQHLLAGLEAIARDTLAQARDLAEAGSFDSAIRRLDDAFHLPEDRRFRDLRAKIVDARSIHNEVAHYLSLNNFQDAETRFKSALESNAIGLAKLQQDLFAARAEWGNALAKNAQSELAAMQYEWINGVRGRLSSNKPTVLALDQTGLQGLENKIEQARSYNANDAEVQKALTMTANLKRFAWLITGFGKALEEDELAEAAMRAEQIGKIELLPTSSLVTGLKSLIQRRQETLLANRMTQVDHALSTGDLNQAIQIAKEVADLYPKDPNVNNILKKAKENTESAWGFVQKAKQANVKSHFIEVGAMMQEAKTKWPRITDETEFKEFQLSLKSVADEFYKKGKEAHSKRQWSVAVAHYKIAVALDPDNASARSDSVEANSFYTRQRISGIIASLAALAAIVLCAVILINLPPPPVTATPTPAQTASATPSKTASATPFQTASAILTATMSATATPTVTLPTFTPRPSPTLSSYVGKNSLPGLAIVDETGKTLGTLQIDEQITICEKRNVSYLITRNNCDKPAGLVLAQYIRLQLPSSSTQRPHKAEVRSGNANAAVFSLVTSAIPSTYLFRDTDFYVCSQNSAMYSVTYETCDKSFGWVSVNSVDIVFPTPIPVSTPTP